MISSIGRRNYLAKWFRDAARFLGEEVRIIAGDGDPNAPGLVDADVQVELPRITSENYIDELIKACVQNDVRLVLSVHDYDIATISTHALDRLQGQGIVVAVPPKETLEVVADKMLTIEVLGRAGLAVPPTVLATDSIPRDSGRQVIKHRFGSGSSGVFIVSRDYLSQAITMSALTAPRNDGSRSGKPDPSLVVIQQAIDGDEYGLDVVCDFTGAYHGVLARKKLRMRAGETDRAMTVDPTPFEDLARTLASTLALRGNTDVDVIVTPDGEQYIIDINPRFGGGYPFVHVAGANVPACYLAWALDHGIDPTWLQYEIGVVSSKYQAVQRSGQL